MNSFSCFATASGMPGKAVRDMSSHSGVTWHWVTAMVTAGNALVVGVLQLQSLWWLEEITPVTWQQCTVLFFLYQDGFPKSGITSVNGGMNLLCMKLKWKRWLVKKLFGNELGRELWLVYHDVMSGVDRLVHFTTSQNKMYFVSPCYIIVMFVGEILTCLQEINHPMSVVLAWRCTDPLCSSQWSVTGVLQRALPLPHFALSSLFAF